MLMTVTQTYFLSVIVLKTIPQRLASAASTIVSTGCAVGVLIATLTFAGGLYETIRNTGHSDHVIVIARGAVSEIGSFLSRSAVAQVKDAPGISRSSSNNLPLASANALILVALEQRNQKGTANATVRGVDWTTFNQIENFRFTEGRALQTGKHELIVGKSAKVTFVGLNIGDKVRLGNSDWEVVGTFTSNGDAHESEILTDAESLLAAYRQPAFQSVTAKLENEGMFSVFSEAIDNYPNLNVNVIREKDYYDDLSRPISGVVFLVAYIVGGIMSVGAIFSAINSMYISVDSRSSEITALRAIGFGRFVIVISTILESWVLSVLGGVVGIATAAAIFEGKTMSTVGNGSANASSLGIVLHVTPELFAYGLIVASCIGFLGGLLPSLLAVKQPISVAIRS